MSELILKRYRELRDEIYEEGKKFDKHDLYHSYKNVICLKIWLEAESVYFNAVQDYFGDVAIIDMYSGEICSSERKEIPLGEFYSDLFWSIKERRNVMASQKSRGRPRKFDRDTARAIRKAVREGLSVTDAAKERGVNVVTINKVVKGEGAYANTL